MNATDTPHIDSEGNLRIPQHAEVMYLDEQEGDLVMTRIYGQSAAVKVTRVAAVKNSGPCSRTYVAIWGRMHARRAVFIDEWTAQRLAQAA